MELKDKFNNLFNKKKNLSKEKEKIIQNILANIKLEQRLDFEWEAIQMGIEPIRIVKNPDYKLTDVLTQAGIDLSDYKVKTSHVVIEDWIGKKYRKIDNILNYSIFEDHLTKDSEGKLDVINGMSRNINLFISIENKDKEGFICIHVRPRGRIGEDMTLQSRFSIVKIMDGDNDLYINKVLVTFDLQDPHKQFVAIESLRNAAIEKLKNGEQLNQLEEQSINLHKSIGAYRGLAEMRMKSERWGDAASALIEAYRALKKEILTREVNEEWLNAFHDVCFNLGLCYYNRGLYVKAALYFELAINDTSKTEYKRYYEDCLRELQDVRIGGAIDTSRKVASLKKSFLGEFLETVYDVLPDELSNLIWVDNETCESGEIKKQKDIWHLNVKELLKNHNNISLYLSYRASKKVLDDDFLDPNQDYTVQQPDIPEFKFDENYLKLTTFACKDKSKGRVDNVLVITLTRKGSEGTMTIMMPEFNLSDNNNNHYPKVVKVKFALTPLMTEEVFNQIRITATEKIQKNDQLEPMEYMSLGSQRDAHYLFIQGKIAFDYGLWGDVIHLLSQVYPTIVSKWNTSDLDDFDRSMLGEICFMLGYAYNEIMQYEYAIYYLGLVEGNKYPSFWTVEFINALTNSEDVRALGAVNYQIRNINEGKYSHLKKDELIKFKSFLKRRYGYILIDHHRIKEAKEYLRSLLNDPYCGDFASSELKYIADTFPDEK